MNVSNTMPSLLAFALATAVAALPAAAASTVQEIRNELMSLPYYGVFDFLAFRYDKGTVTLSGYAYAATLKSDAEREVKHASGVDTVVNKIEPLPVSQNDDQIRWATFRAIYRSPELAQYGNGLSSSPGNGWRSRPFSPFGAGAAFPGQEPLGNPAIHIIVKNGRMTLLGVVNNQGDKTIDEMKARSVPGQSGVTNQLQIVSTVSEGGSR